MLPTFVIGLREGLEAALIVGMVAAFLRKQGQRDLLRWVLAGVAVAVLVCLLVGVALEVYSRDLPQREQEGLETVIGILAVGMVTYMVSWMRRHSRELKGQLEGLAADALASGSHAGRALVLMAFLAVIREGFETVVFLLAAFNQSQSAAETGGGALLGVAVSIALGYGIYRGGVRLNLSRFFRVTGFVLVLVAAGIVVNALHTAREAGWLNAGQGRTLDLTWLVEPGTVQSSLLTGMLGIQPHPTMVETIGWLVYLIPVGLYVAWPSGRPAPARAMLRLGGGIAVACAIAAAGLALFAPAAPVAQPATTSDGITATVATRGAKGALVVLKQTGATEQRVQVSATGRDVRAGVPVEEFRGSVAAAPAAGADQPAALSLAEVARLNNGRLPIGLRSTTDAVPVAYRTSTSVAVWLDDASDRVIDLAQTQQVRAVVRPGDASFVLPEPVATNRSTLSAQTVTDAAAAARADSTATARRSVLAGFLVAAVVLGVVALAAAAAGGWLGRRRPPQPVEQRRLVEAAGA